MSNMESFLLEIFDWLKEENNDSSIRLHIGIEETLIYNGSLISNPKNDTFLFSAEISNIEGEQEQNSESKTPNPDSIVCQKNLIEIKKKENCIQFFLLAKGHKPSCFNEKINTKIGIVIEKYIKEIGEKTEIKNTFYYKDQKIDDLDSTIECLGINSLGFIVSKLV